jgi:hypothetical protein
MTGPEAMTVMAALQVGALALARVVAPVARRAPVARFWGSAVFGTSGAGVLEVVMGEWWVAAGSAIAALVAVALWWHYRRKGRRRAARDALVRKARELSLPRPVLAPGGAG